MKSAIIIAFAALLSTARAAPTVLHNGLLVTGDVVVADGRIIENGETNATQPWVVSQINDSTGAVAQATAGRFARITVPVEAFALDLSATWYDTGAGAWTNEAGWETTVEPLSNGIYWSSSAFSEDSYLRSPVVTGGLARVTATIATQHWAHAWYLTDYDGNDYLGLVNAGESIDQAMDSQVSGRATIYFDQYPHVDGYTNMVLLSSMTVWTWSTPEYVGTTNDHRAQRILIRDASMPDEPVTLRQLSNTVHAIRIGSADAWSAHPAIEPVHLDGRPIHWDNAYSTMTSTGALVFAWHGNPIMTMIAGSYLASTNPQIAGASLVDTTVTLAVVAATGWRPYPEWSTDTVTWTRLATNQFFSSYPAQSNGAYTISFVVPTLTTAYYRVWSTNESGGSITGTVDILSENLLHRGQPVARVSDLLGFGAVVTAALNDASTALAAAPEWRQSATGTVNLAGHWLAGVGRVQGVRATNTWSGNEFGLHASGGVTNWSVSDGAGNVGVLWSALNFAPAGCLTAAAAATNYWRITSPPATPTNFGAYGQIAVTPSNIAVYSHTAGRWIVIPTNGPPPMTNWAALAGDGVVFTNGQFAVDPAVLAVTSSPPQPWSAYLGSTAVMVRGGSVMLRYVTNDIDGWAHAVATEFKSADFEPAYETNGYALIGYEVNEIVTNGFFVEAMLDEFLLASTSGAAEVYTQFRGGDTNWDWSRAVLVAEGDFSERYYRTIYSGPRIPSHDVELVFPSNYVLRTDYHPEHALDYPPGGAESNDLFLSWVNGSIRYLFLETNGVIGINPPALPPDWTPAPPYTNGFWPPPGPVLQPREPAVISAGLTEFDLLPLIRTSALFNAFASGLPIRYALSIGNDVMWDTVAPIRAIYLSGSNCVDHWAWTKISGGVNSAPQDSSSVWYAPGGGPIGGAKGWVAPIVGQNSLAWSDPCYIGPVIPNTDPPSSGWATRIRTWPAIVAERNPENAVTLVVSAQFGLSDTRLSRTQVPPVRSVHINLVWGSALTRVGGTFTITRPYYGWLSGREILTTNMVWPGEYL